ncbi:S1 family peptidase [Formosa haliotis]|uniref:S1 family peptidase n=1 Tax=Formosa haliotis TaxID=1555194 RepID=UPI00082436ED|nr:serine protease [Formosa haliotis]
MKHFSKTIFLILTFLVGSIQAQELYKNSISTYKVGLKLEAEKLINAGDVVSGDSLSTMLKAKGYNPIDINLKSMQKKNLSPSEIYKRVSEAAVIVSPVGITKRVGKNGKAHKDINTYPASGYIIDSEGIIVTNYHVVSGFVYSKNTKARDVLVVMMKDGTVFPVKAVLAADKTNDLAILKIDPKGKELPALTVATKDAEIGDPVYIVSNPKGYYYAFASGMVTDKFSELKIGGYRNIMAISADYAAGSSGAAIIDQFGNVIATVCYTKTLNHSDNPARTQMVLKATIPASSLLNLLHKGN